MKRDYCDYIWSAGYLFDYHSSSFIGTYNTECFIPRKISHEEIISFIHTRHKGPVIGFNPTLRIQSDGAVTYSDCQVKHIGLTLTIQDAIDFATDMISSWDIPTWLDDMCNELICQERT